nr:hypothetical protein [Peribacillus simplex]
MFRFTFINLKRFGRNKDLHEWNVITKNIQADIGVMFAFVGHDSI